MERGQPVMLRSRQYRGSRPHAYGMARIVTVIRSASLTETEGMVSAAWEDDVWSRRLGRPWRAAWFWSSYRTKGGCRASVIQPRIAPRLIQNYCPSIDSELLPPVIF